jgi:putative GTP pyrophosphokinase
MNNELLRIAYQDNVGRADRLREALITQLLELIGTNEITLGVPIESRIKSWTSIEEKLQRKNLSLGSIYELQDFVGVRMIVLFRSDLDRAVKLISDTFDVVSAEDTSARLSEAEFGYQSRHFVVKLPKTWLSLPSLASLSDFQVELQVRTLAQHIWAAASHKLQYKQEAGVPPPLRRAISRASALLETVDLEFERVLDERRAYASISSTSASLKEPLNVDNLAAVLSDVFPRKNKKDSEPYASLLRDLTALGVQTPEDARRVFAKHLAVSAKADKRRVAEIRADEISDETPEVMARVASGVFFSHVGLAREALSAEFGEDRVFHIVNSTNE